MKFCSKCNQRKLSAEFPRRGGGLYSWCRDCVSRMDKRRGTGRPVGRPRKYPMNKREVIRQPRQPMTAECKASYFRQRKYGLTQAKFDELFAQQNGLCAICHKPETHKRRGKIRKLCVDHCHETNKVRGLLCYKCNIGIGYLQDDPQLLKSAILYLERHYC